MAFSRHLSLLGLIILFFLGCSSPQDDSNKNNVVRVRISSLPESNSPVGQWNFDTNQILNRLYQSVEQIDPLTLEVVPYLATRESVDVDSLIKVSFKLFEDIYWDDGQAITSKDIESSLKIYNIPGINNRRKKLQLSHIIDFIPSESANEFSLVVRGNWEDVQKKVATFPVLPKYIFDPNGYLDLYSVSEIRLKSEELKDAEQIIKYKQYFDSDTLNRSITAIKGPYLIESWDPGQSVSLVKNEAWWGNQFVDRIEQLRNRPDRIVYEYIPDATVALLALKNDAIDVLARVKPSEFKNMMSDEDLKERYHFVTPTTYGFVYLAINGRLPKFSKPIRQAIASLIPYDDLIEFAAESFAQRSVGPINPIDKAFYNDTLTPDELNFSQAEEILLNEGFSKNGGVWQNENGDPFELELIYAAGTSHYEKIALILKERMAAFGINLSIVPVERSLQMEKMKGHQFELSIRSFRGGPFSHNFAPLFSTKAANIGGLNFSGFGDVRSDSVINLINNTPEKSEKIKAMKELQRLLHEERNMLFLFFEKDRIAVNKKFDNVQGFSISPGFDITKFTLRSPN